MQKSEKTIYVYENWIEQEPHLIGKLHSSFARANETFCFEYDDEWLRHSEASYSLDPDLALYGGR